MTFLVSIGLWFLGFLVGGALLAVAQHPPPAPCEDLRAIAVEQATLLHQDYMRTQGLLAEALAKLKKVEGELAATRAPKPDASSLSPSLPVPDVPAAKE